MVFCNTDENVVNLSFSTVTILILVDGFLQSRAEYAEQYPIKVTILILVDGFLQSD